MGFGKRLVEVSWFRREEYSACGCFCNKMSDISEPYDDDIPASSDESREDESAGYLSSNEEHDSSAGPVSMANSVNLGIVPVITAENRNI